jgi:transposase
VRGDRRVRPLRADQLSAYLGIVPSENTTGERRRQGAITKAGAAHARRLLIEASYNYQRRPGITAALERRRRGQDATVATSRGERSGA